MAIFSFLPPSANLPPDQHTQWQRYVSGEIPLANALDQLRQRLP